jgi:UPF0716 family protein affecting phage T7 exclusion
MTWWERILGLAAGLLLIDPGTVTDLVGIVLLVFVTAIQYRKARSSRGLLKGPAAAIN